MDISPLDVINIGMLTRRVLSLLDYRRALHDYLLSKMEQVAPNLAALVGELVGARLISHAGSLTSLAKYPASTVQILGFDSLLLCSLLPRRSSAIVVNFFVVSFVSHWTLLIFQDKH